MALATGVVIAFAAGHSSGGFNLLVNGDLETLPHDDANVAAGWTLVEPDLDQFGATVNSADYASFANHTAAGSRGLWLRPWMGDLLPSSPETVNADMYQDVAANAGQLYTLSAWFRFESNYPGFIPSLGTRTELAIEFRNAGNSLIGAAILDVDSAYTPNATWQMFTIISVAPIGTETVRVRASMVDGEFNIDPGQSAFVDDFVLVPAPGALALFGLIGLGCTRRRRGH